MADSDAEAAEEPRDATDINQDSLVRVGDFVGLCAGVIEQDDMSLERSNLSQQALADLMEIPSATVEELGGVCSVDSLGFPKETSLAMKRVDLTNGIPPGAEELQTVLTRKKFLEDGKLRRSYNSLSWELERQHMINAPNEESMLTEPEAVLTAIIFHPVVKNFRAIIDREILVLGQQCLTDLRDSILCVSDLSVSGDFSEAPNLPQDNKAQDNFKSAFFFIENTFYNDMRDPLCRDLSEPIREWAKSRRKGWPLTFDTKKMEETNFNDLSIKLGKPYLYCHQGDCEHVIAFADLRLLHADDCHDVSQYPLVTRKISYQRMLCRVCKRFTSNDRCSCVHSLRFFCFFAL
ncbi:snRNA-activating protein complex subunit 3-like isoform X2 [Ptychodera flava]|uniref:snRNA-activating protein complex subunit 3-like isoform X2 n=1 Tax=Ptychodera flava TaxID=63121 RepID=UPI00396A0A48